jgi:hypothetical protein
LRICSSARQQGRRRTLGLQAHCSFPAQVGQFGFRARRHFGAQIGHRAGMHQQNIATDQVAEAEVRIGPTSASALRCAEPQIMRRQVLVDIVEQLFRVGFTGGLRPYRLFAA